MQRGFHPTSTTRQSPATRRRLSTTLGVLALALTLVSFLDAAPAFGQAQSGNLFGKTVDNSGDALPGVTITVAGAANQVQITDERGEFRFLGLSPGSYDLTA